jgi:hypothetical protein
MALRILASTGPLIRNSAKKNFLPSVLFQSTRFFVSLYVNHPMSVSPSLSLSLSGSLNLSVALFFLSNSGSLTISPVHFA